MIDPVLFVCCVLSGLIFFEVGYRFGKSNGRHQHEQQVNRRLQSLNRIEKRDGPVS